MKQTILIALALSASALAGIRIFPATRFEFTDCEASPGSAPKTILAGTYVFRVTDEDVYVCIGSSSCVADGGPGGDRWPVGTVVTMTFPENVAASCRSAGGTGDAIFTKASDF